MNLQQAQSLKKQQKVMVELFAGELQTWYFHHLAIDRQGESFAVIHKSKSGKDCMWESVHIDMLTSFAGCPKCSHGTNGGHSGRSCIAVIGVDYEFTVGTEPGDPVKVYCRCRYDQRVYLKANVNKLPQE